ncbi:hypothetical protein ACFL0K_02060 [Patescibacteria group bacterium]
MNLKPLVFHGALSQNPEQLMFHIVDHKLYIPMSVEVYGCVYNHTNAYLFGDNEESGGWWGLDPGDEQRANIWGCDETLIKLVHLLMFAEGLDRLWVTSNAITVQGNPVYYAKLTETIKITLSDLFGDLEFIDAGNELSAYVADITAQPSIYK